MIHKYLFEQDIPQYAVESFESIEDPRITCVNNGTVLPAKIDRNKVWGLGGVLDENDLFVEESRLDENFGGKYSYDKEKTIICRENILFLGVFPNHWGHFLIDVLCKLWCIDSISEDVKIAYVGVDWIDSKEISKVFVDALELVGINRERLMYIDEPTFFDKILIPDRTLGFKHSWHSKYKIVIEKMIQNACAIERQKGTQSYEKIYFTRTRFAAARKKEVGEKIIADFFERNGYEIISPELLSVTEQIFLFNSCREFACVSGTLAHNSLFAQKDAQLTIFNRTNEANPPQLRIDQLTRLTITYVDAFSSRELKKRTGYNARDNRIVHVLEINENVKNYAKDNNMRLPTENCIVKLQNNITWSVLSFRQFLATWKHKIFG